MTGLFAIYRPTPARSGSRPQARSWARRGRARTGRRGSGCRPTPTRGTGRACRCRPGSTGPFRRDRSGPGGRRRPVRRRRGSKGGWTRGRSAGSATRSSSTPEPGADGGAARGGRRTRPRPGDVLPAGQYLAGTVLTDRQQRRQAVYRHLFSGHGPRHLEGRDLLLAWADPPDLPFAREEDVRWSARCCWPSRWSSTGPRRHAGGGAARVCAVTPGGSTGPDPRGARRQLPRSTCACGSSSRPRCCR